MIPTSNIYIVLEIEQAQEDFLKFIKELSLKGIYYLTNKKSLINLN